MNPQLLMICGLHRSGTTYVGEMLRQANICVVHEPLNERFGVLGVPVAYPFLAEDGGCYSKLIDDVVGFKLGWNCSADIGNNKLKRFIYKWTGGRSGMRWSKLRFQKLLGVLPSNIGLKDPFSTLATPYFIKKHSAKAVCMVRHPAAIHYSTVKQGWWFSIDNLCNQPELMSSYALDISEQHWVMAREHHAASIALLWKLMVRVNRPLIGKGLILVRHEDLCVEPEIHSRNIFEHLGVTFDAKVANFVVTNSEGSSAEFAGGTIHDFKRDAKSLPNIWRGRIPLEDERMIREICAEELFEIYGDDQ